MTLPELRKLRDELVEWEASFQASEGRFQRTGRWALARDLRERRSHVSRRRSAVERRIRELEGRG